MVFITFPTNEKGPGRLLSRPLRIFVRGWLATLAAEIRDTAPGTQGAGAAIVFVVYPALMLESASRLRGRHGSARVRLRSRFKRSQIPGPDASGVPAMTTKLDPISLLRSLERAHLQQAAKLRSAASAQEPSEFLRRLADVR